MTEDIISRFSETLSNVGLFSGVGRQELQQILMASRFFFAEYCRDDIIMWEQTPVEAFGVVLLGNAAAYKSTSSGNDVIMTHLSQGSVFGDILAGSDNKKSPVSIRALGYMMVLYIDYDSYITACLCGGKKGEMLVRNYIKAVSKRYFEIQDRVSCIIMPTLRDKIFSCLTRYAKDDGAPFDVPFGRESMAEYLNADRSALSRELSKMKKEGLIDYYRSTFRLTGGRQKIGIGLDV